MKQTGVLLLLLVVAATTVLAESPNPSEGAQGMGEEQGVPSGNSSVNASLTKGAADDTPGKTIETETQQQNKGEETQLQNEVQVKAGEYNSTDGKQVKIQLQEGNMVQLQSGGVTATTAMQMVQEKVQDKTMLKVQLSNGANAEVKVMPDAASERALERLRLNVCSEENGCQIELKEVGKGEEVKAAYELQTRKEAKVLGMFKTTVQAKVQVDAENGELIKVKKPWWASLTDETA